MDVPKRRDERTTRRLDPVPPRFVYLALSAVRGFFSRVVRRMVPARVALFEQFTGIWLTQMIYAAAKLGVADELASGPKSADDLAAAVGAHPDALARLMRALVSVGIFQRQRDGRFALNRWAEPLRSDRDDSMRDIVLFLGSPQSMRGWERFVEAVQTGESAFELAHGKSIFEFLGEHPDDEAVFHGGMVSMTELDAPALVRGFDYGRFSTLCDVGGGRGTLLAAILSAHPSLRGVLFDAPGALDDAPGVFAAWNVAERATTVAGSFFDAVPAGCDAYVLKEILHDWDDERASSILTVCRRAMRPGATLLVIEMLLIDDDRPHVAKLLDMEMLDMTPRGRQRSAEEFRRLLEQTGFRLHRVIPLSAPFSIIDSVAV